MCIHCPSGEVGSSTASTRISSRPVISWSTNCFGNTSLRFRLTGKVGLRHDPDVRSGTQGKTLSRSILVHIELPRPTIISGQQSGATLALKLGGLALAVVAILALLFLPRRWAKARAARQPIRPFLTPPPNGVPPATVATEGDAPHARQASPNGATHTSVTTAHPGPGLGGEQVEGVEAVRELLRAQRRQVKTVWLADDVNDPTIEELAERARVPVRRAPRSDVDSASRSGLAGGVLAHHGRCHRVDLDDLSEPDDGPMTVLVLDHMADASLGALIRTGVSCGVTAVVLPRQRSNPISRDDRGDARGAIEHVGMALVPSIPSALARLRANGFLVVGINAAAPERLLDLAFDFAKFRVVLVIDGRGQLDHLVRSRCDLVAGVDLPPGAQRHRRGRRSTRVHRTGPSPDTGRRPLMSTSVRPRRRHR